MYELVARLSSSIREREQTMSTVPTNDERLRAEVSTPLWQSRIAGLRNRGATSCFALRQDQLLLVKHNGKCCGKQLLRIDRWQRHHAAAWPRSLSGKLLAPHAPFPLECFPALVDTSTWLSSSRRLSLKTFPGIVPFQYFFHSSTNSCKGGNAPFVWIVPRPCTTTWAARN